MPSCRSTFSFGPGNNDDENVAEEFREIDPNEIMDRIQSNSTHTQHHDSEDDAVDYSDLASDTDEEDPPSVPPSDSATAGSDTTSNCAPLGWTLKQRRTDPLGPRFTPCGGRRALTTGQSGHVHGVDAPDTRRGQPKSSTRGPKNGKSYSSL